MTIKPIELGCAGHLIVAHLCRWHRHTQVGPYRVSSVGDYYVSYRESTERTPIGSGDGDFFETLVFRTSPRAAEGSEGCGCRAVKSWVELDGQRYATAGAAQAGHEAMVRKYLARARKEER